jgi:hypothetical protein
MEHFKQLFGPGNSDSAKILPLNFLDLPDFLSGFASWNFASRVRLWACILLAFMRQIGA